jgi:S-formylglutathione hydrolase FrmB
MGAATTVLAAGGGGSARHGLSLLHGWLPTTIQVLAAALVLAAIGWRSRRWRRLWVPIAVAAGIGTAAWARWYIDSQGLADDPAPPELWIWIGVAGLAAAVLVMGWRSARWYRRLISVLAVSLCVLSIGVALNLWVGYFPTVQTAWNALTTGPLPDESNMATVTAMRQQHTVPTHGAVVPVSIPANPSAGSNFKHRTEYVYLPPAWFASPRVKLPTVMMISGEFNTPGDWLRTGNAAATIDMFAATHGGDAPVFVFVDAGGSFNNDTECVNGPRGNVADHLTKDIVPYMISTFDVSAGNANWSVIGWSMGGTCAVDLTVMHPDLFSSFVDVAGDVGPNAGTKSQTIKRLFGGSAAQWAAYDPSTVITKHGPYPGVSGWFAISSDPLPPRQSKPVAQNMNEEAVGLGGQDANGRTDDQTEAANTLCSLGRANGIDCAVVATPGRHDWPFASKVFASSLPWLAGQIGTPSVSRIPLPDSGGQTQTVPQSAALAASATTTHHH